MFSNKVSMVAAILAVTTVSLAAKEKSDVFSRDAIIEVMKRAADNNLRLQAADQQTSKADVNYEWVRGAFYTGVTALYYATGDEKYLNSALDYSNSRNWQLDKPDTRHADWQCIGQTYAELFLLQKAREGKGDPKRIEGICRNVDAMIAAPQPGRVDWWWCDALYMAPPVLARLHKATGEQKYLEFLNTMYWDTYDFLYDKEEHLWFRDKNYFDKTTTHGKEVFWSRGNGWVHAGLARLIPYLPKDEPSRAKYIQLFKDMSEKIASIQPEDGLWRPSLLDPDDFATSETSGSAFYTFALAWGINEGLLDRAKYEPVVKRGWAGLVSAVTPEGKLGYVQKVAAAPGPVNPEDTREYAVGAFLQAGKEMLRLLHGNKEVFDPTK